MESINFLYKYGLCPVEPGINHIKLALFEYEDVNIPHFHFFRVKDVNKYLSKKIISTGGCICLDRPAYLFHDMYHDTLTKEEMDSVIEILNSSFIRKITNLTMLGNQWNAGNTDYRFNFNQSILTYTYDMPIIEYKK